MSWACLLIGDGRDEVHERSVASAEEHLPRADYAIKIDDRDHTLGFAGAIAEGWRQVRATAADWVFHLEADFIFNAPVLLEEMIELLSDQEHLAQVALKRQPWNEEEKAAGGIVERAPDAFTQRVEAGRIWTEHRRFFTTNPSVYSAKLCDHGWPQEAQSEGVFTHRLLADPQVRFALWGGKFDAPAVTHIGEVRAGTGY